MNHTTGAQRYNARLDKIFDFYRENTTYCKQCGSGDDKLAMLTKHGLCGKCVRKNHRRVVR